MLVADYLGDAEGSRLKGVLAGEVGKNGTNMKPLEGSGSWSNHEGFCKSSLKEEKGTAQISLILTD